MGLTVAIAGATGAVGADLLKLLERGTLPVDRLVPLASERSAGKKIRFGGEEVEVGVLGKDSFAGVDLALFSAGGGRSREFAPAAVEAGAVVVDNSSAFRMDPDVPLVVPEINGDAIRDHRGIVANPNCTTIVTLMAVAPLHRAYGLTELRAASYQAASGAGARAMQELLDQTAVLARNETVAPAAFPHQIAYNVIPQIGPFAEGDYTEEELKLRNEGRKILDHPELRVSCTCVRVPVLRAHCVAAWIRTEEPISPEGAREILSAAPGVMVLDDPREPTYPMPITAAGTEPVQVGRIRRDEIDPERGLALFLAGDQLLKGAALNAVQIAERLWSEGLLSGNHHDG